MAHYESDQARLEAIRAELDDVGSALAHLDDGTYGLCQACGSPIAQDLLAAVPMARYCLEHQGVAALLPRDQEVAEPNDGWGTGE